MKVDILTLDYLSFDLVLRTINSISLMIIDKKIVDKIDIKIVENVDFLARTGFDENGTAKIMEINKKITKVKLKKIFFKVILHELAHIIAEKKYGYSGHGEKYEHTCRLLGIPCNKKITLSKEEMEEMNYD